MHLYLVSVYIALAAAAAAAAVQPQRYAGLILLAPMISLEKLKRKGLNPILL
jgi:alpha-beta hydrolase superfamily lysophospholipase